jgi:hypothetical protein
MKSLPRLDSDPSISRPDFTESGLPNQKQPSLGGNSPKESQIEFLCPNGHKLHGPASLQGKPGECPECGSRFHIPTYDHIPSEEKPARAAPAPSPSGRNAPGNSSMAGLFERLWNARSDGATLEIHFRDRETLVPQQFLESLSSHDQAVFSVQEPDGTFTLTAVAWAAVDRVVLRGLKSVPKKFVE